MDYTEFAELAADAINTARGWEGTTAEHLTKSGVRVRWTIGGSEGTGYDDGGSDRPVSAEPEPGLDELDIILEKVAPQVTFIAYKRIVSEVVTTNTDTSHGYYGEVTNYAEKSFNLKNLYLELKKRDLLPTS